MLIISGSARAIKIAFLVFWASSWISIHLLNLVANTILKICLLSLCIVLKQFMNGLFSVKTFAACFATSVYPQWTISMNLASFIFNNSCFIWSLTVRGNSYSIAAKAKIDLMMQTSSREFYFQFWNISGINQIGGRKVEQLINWDNSPPVDMQSCISVNDKILKIKLTEPVNMTSRIPPNP